VKANLNAVTPDTGTDAPKLPAASTDEFLTADELLERLPLGRGSLRARMKDGTIPFIKNPGGRKLLFFWPAVCEALQRQQRGGHLS